MAGTAPDVAGAGAVDVVNGLAPALLARAAKGAVVVDLAGAWNGLDVIAVAGAMVADAATRRASCCRICSSSARRRSYDVSIAAHHRQQMHRNHED